MSEIKVNSIKGVGASAAAITVNNTDGTCTANLTNRTNRNLIINGAMQVAQRGTSSTTTGIQTVDRFNNAFSGTDEAPTQAQADISAGTTPYTLGFRKSYKITNGNQTSGAGAADYCSISYKLESQDISNSGWNYLSSSSKITLSFWVKSSVAQNFYGYILAPNAPGGGDLISFETGSLTADTWTKITKTIPGDSNLAFDNDNGLGMQIHISQFWGTDYTDGSHSLNTWATYSGSSRMPDNTSTWYTTNDATFEITGVQLEVGSVATDFEHRSFGQELQLCKRYFQKMERASQEVYAAGYYESNTQGRYALLFPLDLRADPTITYSAASTFTNINTGALGTGTDMTTVSVTPQCAFINCTVNSGGTDGQACLLASASGQTSNISVSAEL